MKISFKVRSVFEKGGLCFYVMPKDGRATEFFMYIHGGGFGVEDNTQ